MEGIFVYKKRTANKKIDIRYVICYYEFTKIYDRNNNIFIIQFQLIQTYCYHFIEIYQKYIKLKQLFE